MKIRALLTLLVLLPLLPVQAMQLVRVSVKIIKDSNGNLPVADTNANFDARFFHTNAVAVRALFDQYNRLLDSHGRGVRLLLTDATEIAGISEWFGVDARDGDNRRDLEIQAKLNPSKYGFRADAINVYVNNSSSGISAGHVPFVSDVIFIGVSASWSTILHEIGHALGLCHTHGCDCNDDCVGLSDGIADTVKDGDKWQRVDVALQNFNTTNLNTLQSQQVDLVWNNLMSYHVNRIRLSRDQWEKIIDVMGFEKSYVVVGKTVFVDRSNTCVRPEDLIEPFKTLAGYVPGWSWGTRQGLSVHLDAKAPAPPAPSVPLPCPSTGPCAIDVCLGGPFKTLSDGINGASAGDRLQIKAGNYNERMRITKRITLTTDRGTVRIGSN
jgi:Pregnancy-associated plasma protein-A